jgi:hypothetical protein
MRFSQKLMLINIEDVVAKSLGTEEVISLSLDQMCYLF